MRYAFVDSLGSSVSFLVSVPRFLQIISKAESYQLLTHQALPSGHAVEQIVLVPSIEKALILSGK